MGFELETQGSLSSSDYQSSSSSGAESQREGSRRRSSSLLRHQSSSCLAVLRGHEGDVFSLAHSGQTLYSGSDCGEVRAWRWPLIAAGELDQSIQGKFGPATQFGCGEGSVKAMVVIGHKVFTAHQDHKIRVWKRSKKTEVGACTGASHKLVATLPTVKDYVVTCITPKAYIQVCLSVCLSLCHLLPPSLLPHFFGSYPGYEQVYLLELKLKLPSLQKQRRLNPCPSHSAHSLQVWLSKVKELRSLHVVSKRVELWVLLYVRLISPSLNLLKLHLKILQAQAEIWKSLPKSMFRSVCLWCLFLHFFGPYTGYRRWCTSQLSFLRTSIS